GRAQVVAARRLGLSTGPDRGGELRQRAPGSGAGHRRQRDGSGFLVTWPDDHLVLRDVAVGRARPSDLAVLELHPPLAGPRSDGAGADPAAAIADDHAALEVDRGHRDRRTAERRPFRVPCLAIDATGFTAEDHAQQVEVMDRHVDEERLLLEVMPAASVLSDGG